MGARDARGESDLRLRERVGVFLLSACLPPRAFHLGVELDAHNQVLAALAVTLAVSFWVCAAVLSESET